MSNTQVIKDLIERFQEYEKTTRQAGVDDFAYWLIKEKQQPEMQKYLDAGSMDKEALEKINELDNSIGILLGLLNKYAKNYSKVALDDLPLNTLDEFGYLAQLSTHHEMTKSELIARLRDGKTTGTDIIRRLVAQKLLLEVDNPEDKRSKLVKITDKGRKVIMKAYVKMSAASHVVVGSLSHHEKLTLRKIMAKLQNYHQTYEQELQDKLRIELSQIKS